VEIRWLADVGPADAPSTGGKAASLGALIRIGMPVPRGFVVTTRAYAAHAERHGLAEQVAPALARRDWAAMEQAARACLAGPSLDDALRAEVLDAYHRMGAPPVAVRSSSTAEDLSDASFAGQHDTFLEVRGDDAVVDAVGRCWASLWSERAVRYREDRSIDHRAVRMAVVIQEMVPADAAGVAFTVDPVSRRPDRLLIEIAPGLGDAVVSGAVTGESYRVDRETLEIDGPRRRRGFLGSRAAAEVCRLALAIEAHAGCPQDVEFAIARGRIHVLQARPVTTLGGAMSERLPPLEAPSFADRVMKPIAAERYTTAPRPLDLITYTRWLGATIYTLRQIGGVVGAADEAAFRARLWHQAYRLPRARFTWRILLSTWSHLRLLRGDWGAWWAAGPRDDLRAVSAPVDLAALTDEELFDRVDHILAAWEEPLDRRIHVSSAISVEWCLRALVSIVVRGRLRSQILGDLMSGLETPTQEVNDALWALSRVARRDGAVRAAVRDVRPEALPSTPEGRRFAEALASFIERYGHREGAGYHLSTPTWRRDPTQVWRLLASLVEVDERVDASCGARERYDRARALVERRLRLLPGLRHAFGALVDGLRRLHAFRESSHFDLTRPLAALQDIAAEWGRRLVARGLLGAATDVFDLTRDEVRSWLRDPPTPSEAQELLARRRATYRVVDAHWQADRLGAAARGRSLKGIAVSPGVARGPARIILDEAHFDRLHPGDVLICPHSNPAWTPLFVPAAAVVAETGGAASHAAIVAREYGIPAVMAVAGITRALEDGQEVLVDGDRGIVRRIAPRAPWRRFARRRR
jgi:pyruvate,water dikinase